MCRRIDGRKRPLESHHRAARFRFARRTQSSSVTEQAAAPPPADSGTSSSPPVSGGSSFSTAGDKDCKGFATHAEAQAYFEGRGGSPSNNVDRLDNDHDGLACEGLP
ncbi:excalibur calcium-binding domain-containing protein [Nitrolancea hollandica]|uniref:Excalibur calcium-binding domain-containing protein n=1 Tax=Nitrolancea hollandica Lb TaxID=1129897 RepID=I4EGX0_9BACT|nr:excalibur calcium-binding domain-containing protein [Nitrolancea hollandica]CCF83932.1 hypothetical protein NITHO_2860004 [Nitrolancea hollandica Lb]